MTQIGRSGGLGTINSVRFSISDLATPGVDLEMLKLACDLTSMALQVCVQILALAGVGCKGSGLKVRWLCPMGSEDQKYESLIFPKRK